MEEYIHIKYAVGAVMFVISGLVFYYENKVDKLLKEIRDKK